MDIIQKGILTLLKSAVTGEKYSLPETFDLDAALSEIKRHKIYTLAFEGAITCGIPRSNPVMQQLFQKYCRDLLVSEAQMREIQRLCQAFDENGIDYMPLKGCNMKKRYPKPELRLMGDADILIREAQYPQIVPIMESLGFVFQCESDHELIWKSSGLYLELHKRLIPSYQKDLSPYFEDCWERSRISEERCHMMTPEDEWLYLFTHFAKHFRDSGIGCRHVTDLWVFLRCFPELDEAYIDQVLEKLQLLKFHGYMKKLIKVWFEEETPEELSEVMTDYIFVSGNWGSNASSVLSGILRNAGKVGYINGKAQYLWRYAFPDLENMQRRHKILKKAPWLQPGMWGVRLVYKVLFDKQDLKRREQELSVITQDNLRMRKEFLDFVGLPYH